MLCWIHLRGVTVSDSKMGLHLLEQGCGMPPQQFVWFWTSGPLCNPSACSLPWFSQTESSERKFHHLLMAGQLQSELEQACLGHLQLPNAPVLDPIHRHCRLLEYIWSQYQNLSAAFKIIISCVQICQFIFKMNRRWILAALQERCTKTYETLQNWRNCVINDPIHLFANSSAEPRLREGGSRFSQPRINKLRLRVHRHNENQQCGCPHRFESSGYQEINQ